MRARFHTRYAPVRRSPASYCYDPLPLDLHVLGLSLAFILSQDQTLRCIDFRLLFLFSFLGPRARLSAAPLLVSSLARLAACCASNMSKILSFLFSLAPFGAFCFAKLSRISETTKTFLKFFFLWSVLKFRSVLRCKVRQDF